MKHPITQRDILAAAQVLEGVTLKTQFAESRLASARLGAQIYFKMENEQRTGSFKLRGAYNRIATHADELRKRGVVACSAGNHAQGVAYACQALGIPCTVVMPGNASLVKVTHTRSYGADVVLKGAYFDEAAEHARELQQKNNWEFIHPFEDPWIIAGQGTLGLEMTLQGPPLDQVLVPIGGGGLMAGVATAIKAAYPGCQVIGVQSSQAPGMEKLFHHQDAQTHGPVFTIADGIAIKKPSALMYEQYISRLVDDVVLVTDDEIADAIVYVMEVCRALVEGSGAAALAAALAGKVQLKGRVGIVLCGGNIDLNIVSKVIDKGLERKGRLTRLAALVPDAPGNLSRLTQVIAQQGANVLEVRHDRMGHGVALRETRIEFLLETLDADHGVRTREALEAAGARVL